MRRTRFLPVLPAVVLAGLLAGCAGLLADRIVTPPRSPEMRAFSEKMMAHARVPWERVERAFAPDISYVVLEPGDYGLRYRTFSFANDTWSMLMDWHASRARRPARHGTVVLVHGWSMDAYMMLPWAMAFAERGFRAVIVELRGHGRSERGRMGYGQREAGDVVAVIGQLRKQKRLAEPLYLMGVSYGAVTVLNTAARLAEAGGPHPPLAVVAMEPFANAADAIRSMHTFATTAMRGGWRRWVLRATARLFIPDFVVEHAIANASQRLELDLEALDTAVAVAASTSCPLLVHGRIDTVIPYQSSRTLAAAHPAAQLVELPRDGHFSTPARVDLLADPLANWFVALTRDPARGCVPFRAPASTLLAHDGFEKDRVPRHQRPELRPPGAAVLVDPPGRDLPL